MVGFISPTKMILKKAIAAIILLNFQAISSVQAFTDAEKDEILELFKGPFVTSCSAHFHTRPAFSMWGGILRGVDFHVGWRY